MLRVQKLTEHATIPTRGSPLSAGLDLASAYDCVVPAGDKLLIKTDLAVACPTNCYARVAPRSGLTHKKFIDVGAGVIDADYRGNVGVILFNHGKEDFVVAKGDRIAQLILEMILLAPVVEVKELEDTERGAGGFGSTGMKVEKPETEEDPASAKRPREDSSKGELLLLVAEAVKKGLISKEECSKVCERDCGRTGCLISSPNFLFEQLKAMAIAGDEGLLGVHYAFSKNSDDSDLKENLHLLLA
jgi:deoxyuridine 5'-triphosphate nucleotidohydrolase